MPTISARWTRCGAAPDDHPRSRSRDCDRSDRECPEDDPLPEVGACPTGHVRDDEAEPHDHRHEGDDADEVIDRRVLGSLRVTVVEPHRPREHHPQRQAGGKEEELAVERKPVARALRRKNELQRREGDDERPQVCEEQVPADAPTPSTAAGRVRRRRGEATRGRGRSVRCRQ